MKKYLVLIITFISFQVQAGEFFLYPYYIESRVQKKEDQSTGLRSFTSFSLGYQRDSWSVLFERQNFDQSSGNNTLVIHQSLESYVLHGRYFFNQNLIRFYAGAGLGVHQNIVTTHLLGTATTEDSGQNPLTQVTAGAQLMYKFLFVEVEGRVSNGKNLDPVNAVGLLFRLGAGF